jgi:hypothetical protein
MLIEEEIITQTTRVRCNNIPFEVCLDYKDLSRCKIIRISESSEDISYARLITDRAVWAAAIDLKGYIDEKLKLQPIGNEKTPVPKGFKRFRGRAVRPYTFKPKDCPTCGEEFTPSSTRQKQCDTCLGIIKIQ